MQTTPIAMDTFMARAAASDNAGGVRELREGMEVAATNRERLPVLLKFVRIALKVGQQHVDFLLLLVCPRAATHTYTSIVSHDCRVHASTYTLTQYVRRASSCNLYVLTCPTRVAHVHTRDWPRHALHLSITH